MEPITIGIVCLVTLFLLLFIGMPIGFSMAFTGFIGLAWILGFAKALSMLGTVPYHTVYNYTFSVIPLFVLMGEFVYISGMMNGLFNVANKWLGHLPGGLAMATIGACAGFAACCGSSVAGASLMTQMAWPQMKRFGYHDSLALGTIAAGGTLGILIPPSSAFVIYGIIAEQSIGKLFIGGILPGVLLSSLFMIAILLQTSLNPMIGPKANKSSWREKFSRLGSVWLVVLLFLIIMGGIWGGIFSPSEAAGIGAFGAFIITIGKKQLTFKKLKECLANTLKITTMLFTIMIGAMIFNYFLAITELPFSLSDYIINLDVSPIIILIILFFVYIILGCLMDTMAMTLLTIPIILPTLIAFGIDLVWFGVLYTILTELALITPPIGVNVFVVRGIASDVPIGTIFRGILPFAICMIICLAIVTAFPQIALFLPNLM